MSPRERCFGMEPFEPYDHEAAQEELQAEREEWDAAGIVRFFECSRCDGHGCYMNEDRSAAQVCQECSGRGRRGATQEDLDNADPGSDNPFCRHEWSMTAGEADECNGRIYCLKCGADGDA